MSQSHQQYSPLALEPGRYIVAVSGGVDSMVLLDMLRRQPKLHLVVAHIHHGMREDAEEDVRLVQTYCKSHNITCIVQRLHLGAQASEAAARKARYNFLQQCRITNHARAILTAHHQDDLIETAIINILRGTGWRGMSPFMARPHVMRPLLSWTKNSIVAYALAQRLPWREDTTNLNQRYLRNYVRHTVVPWLNANRPTWREKFLQMVRKQHVLRRTIEGELDKYLAAHTWKTHNGIAARRYIWIMLPSGTAYELLQALFMQTLGYSLVGPLARAALLFTKIAKPGKIMALDAVWQLRVTKTRFIVEPRTSMVS